METFNGFVIAVLILIAGGSWIEYSKYKRKLTEGVFFYDTKENLQKTYHGTTIREYIRRRVGTTYHKAFILALIVSIFYFNLAVFSNNKERIVFAVLTLFGIYTACYTYFVKSVATEYYKKQYEMMMN